MSKDEAQEKVRQFVNRSYHPKRPDELVILENKTWDKPYGWVFFYTSRQFLETNDPKYMVGGNSPILVLRGDGSLHALGTARPAVDALAELIERLHLTVT